MNSENRPWGSFQVLNESSAHKVKLILVHPGKRLSYQKHQKRAEHWFVVSGEAQITIDGNIRNLAAGDSVDIAIGVAHRIANKGVDELKFIEVQTGTYFGEDDIVRLEDDFGRS